MPTPATLGKRIAQARRELAARAGRDVAQSDIAKAVGATAASVSEWEKDKKVPREDTLNRLATFLGVTPAFLRYGVRDSDVPVIEDAGEEMLAPVKPASRASGKGRKRA